MVLSIILGIIIVLLLIYIYKQNKQIKSITYQVNEIVLEQNDLYKRQFKEGSISILESEIVKLTNRLYEKNKLLIEDKVILKEALENISHQMKTPLTSMNLIYERLKVSEGKEKRELLKEQEKLLYKMEWLVSTLLKMAQIDANSVIFKKENINQEDFIKQLIDPFEIQLELKNIQLDIQYEDDLYIDYLWTLEAVSNVFKNCIEHSFENGHIKINITNNPLYDEILIEDEGPGIDKEDIENLFNRFYKGKHSKEGSIGIGLALSKMIVESQNGTIYVENTNPGVKFTIHFYKEVI